MSRFYLGQKVRIVRCVQSTWANGLEATIVCKALLNKDRDWGLKIDDVCHPIVELWEASESNLEPLTDSYDLVSWESMRDLWVPEHMREDA